MQVTFIVGPPGSGKRYFAHILGATRGMSWLISDDLTELQTLLDHDYNVIVTDSRLCEADVLHVEERAMRSAGITFEVIVHPQDPDSSR
jgi:hypothetical protein